MSAVPQPDTSLPAPAGLTRTAVCHLDAEAGRLTYRGYDVAELAVHATFEETAWLLTRGALPTRADLRDFRKAWVADQKPSPLDRKLLKIAPPGTDALTVLRAVIAALPFTPPAPDEAVRLMARTAAVVAEWLRLGRAGAPVRWGRDGVAAGFLRVATGREPAAELVRAFDGTLTLRADNELNPGTFAARVAASTGSDLVSCVVAALGALAGPRHSGHTVAVATLLEAAAKLGATAASAAALERSPKPAGFGHPVYRGMDPRTPVARELARAAARASGRDDLFAVAEAVEREIAERTALAPNVDYYLAVVYLAAGIPVTAFGAVFAMARMPGWIAHVQEQWQDPELIRPRAAWVGAPVQRYPVRAPRSAVARSAP